MICRRNCGGETRCRCSRNWPKRFRSAAATAAAFLFLLVSCATSQNARSPLWANLEPGPYQVGFQSDRWYPALNDGELDELEAFLHAQNISDAAIVDLFDTPMYARRDATELKERFPLIVIARGDVVLCEFIASHGYVVQTTPDFSTPQEVLQFLEAHRRR